MNSRVHSVRNILHKQGVLLPPPDLSQRLDSIKNLRLANKLNKFDLPLEDSFLEGLIQENIIQRNHENPDYALTKARNIRALVTSLSPRHQKMFSYIVKSLNNKKEMIGGIAWGGGAFRTVSEASATIILLAVFDLLGITYATGAEPSDHNSLTYHAISGGAFHAAAASSCVSNSDVVKVTSDTNFSAMHNHPEIIEGWSNSCMKKGISDATGNRVKGDVTHDQLLQLGNDFEVDVGVKVRQPLPKPKVYTLPKDIDKLGIDPSHIPPKRQVRATTNAVLWQYGLSELFTTCGNCSFPNKDGEELFLLDMGIFDKYNTPISLIKDAIEKYKLDRSQPPLFYFVITPVKAKEERLPETLYGKRTSWGEGALYKALTEGTNFVDNHFLGKSSDRLEKLGAEGSLIKVRCESYNPKTGKFVELHSAGFDTGQIEREVIIASNIPTKEFLDLEEGHSVIEQLYKNLVHPVFRYTDGNNGPDFYDMYLEKVNKKLGIDNNIPPPASLHRFLAKQALTTATSLASGRKAAII